MYNFLKFINRLATNNIKYFDFAKHSYGYEYNIVLKNLESISKSEYYNILSQNTKKYYKYFQEYKNIDKRQRVYTCSETYNINDGHFQVNYHYIEIPTKESHPTPLQILENMIPLFLGFGVIWPFENLNTNYKNTKNFEEKLLIRNTGFELKNGLTLKLGSDSFIKTNYLINDKNFSSVTMSALEKHPLSGIAVWNAFYYNESTLCVTTIHLGKSISKLLDDINNLFAPILFNNQIAKAYLLHNFNLLNKNMYFLPIQFDEEYKKSFYNYFEKEDNIAYFNTILLDFTDIFSPLITNYKIHKLYRNRIEYDKEIDNILKIIKAIEKN